MGAILEEYLVFWHIQILTRLLHVELFRGYYVEYSQSQYPVPYCLLEISWFDNYFLLSAVSSREISHYSCRAAASYRSIPARLSSAGYQLSRDFGKGVYSWKQTLNYFR